MCDKKHVVLVQVSSVVAKLLPQDPEFLFFSPGPSPNALVLFDGIYYFEFSVGIRREFLATFILELFGDPWSALELSESWTISSIKHSSQPLD